MPCKLPLPFCILALLVTTLDPAAARASVATQRLAEARVQAARHHKLVLLKFGASWCGPCHLLDDVFNEPAVQPILEQHFVVLSLDPAENKRAQHLVTPGAQQLMAKLGSKAIVLPFLAVITPAGKETFRSIRPASGTVEGSSLGFPDEGDDLDWFLQQLHAADPTLTTSQVTVLRQAFLKHTVRRNRAASNASGRPAS